MGRLHSRLDKLAREIEKMRSELHEKCKAHGYDLQAEDVVLLSEKLDRLIAEFQRLSRQEEGNG